VAGSTWLWVAARVRAEVRRLQKRARLLASLPRREAKGRLPDGDGVVVGRVTPTGDTVVAPLAGVPCVSFSFSVTERESRGMVSTPGDPRKEKVVSATRIADTGFVDAVVGEDGARIEVPFTAGAGVERKTDSRRTTGFLRGPDERLRRTLRRYDFDGGTRFRRPRGLRIEERVLLPGEAVTLTGCFRTDAEERTRMGPLSDPGDPSLWLITDRSPRRLVGNARRRVARAALGLVVWVLSLPTALVALSLFFRRVIAR
jgi:hypothetical protein